MFNLMEMGLQAQRMTVQANQYMRHVSRDEFLINVHQEAIDNQCFVWANPNQGKTLICRNQPSGEGWNKCHPRITQEAI